MIFEYAGAELHDLTLVPKNIVIKTRVITLKSSVTGVLLQTRMTTIQ